QRLAQLPPRVVQFAAERGGAAVPAVRTPWPRRARRLRPSRPRRRTRPLLAAHGHEFRPSSTLLCAETDVASTSGAAPGRSAAHPARRGTRPALIHRKCQCYSSLLSVSSAPTIFNCRPVEPVAAAFVVEPGRHEAPVRHIQATTCGN